MTPIVLVSVMPSVMDTRNQVSVNYLRCQEAADHDTCTRAKCHFPLSVMPSVMDVSAGQNLRHDTYDTYDTCLHPTRTRAHAHTGKSRSRLQSSVISVIPSFEPTSKAQS